MDPNLISECKNCQTGIVQNKVKLISISLFILTTSIYGTIKLVSNIIDYFSH